MSYSRGYRQRYPEIECQYELQETLGSGKLQYTINNTWCILMCMHVCIYTAGGFAKVKAATHKLTGEKVRKVAFISFCLLFGLLLY